MMPFRKILFPIDFSEAAVALVPHVREMAQRFSAAVTVLNAFNLVSDYGLAPHSTERDAIPYMPAVQGLRKQLEDRLQEFARTQFPGVSVTALVEDGDPAKVIEWAAQREHSDLIMMPTKGLGRFRRLLLGSVTAKVLHDISCPVLTSAHLPEALTTFAGGYRSILCAVELNPEADMVLKTACLLAKAYGARTCLVHIGRSSPEHGGARSGESLRNAFDTVLGSDSPEVNVEVTVRVLDAGVPEGIRRAALEEAADLVVVGRGHQTGNLSRVWSHLYEIIRESPCPVLSV